MITSKAQFEPGDVILLTFPFSDLEGVKKRPALVLLDTKDSDIVVCRITSRIFKTPFDIFIKNWKASGLLLPSVARIHKIATIEKNLVKRTLGKLSKNDWEKISLILKKLWRI